MVGYRKHPGVLDGCSPPQPAALTRGTSARRCGPPAPPAVIRSAPPGESRAHSVRPIEGQPCPSPGHSRPVTSTGNPPRLNRKPARRTFAVAGSTVAAAPLLAVGVTTAAPGAPGATRGARNGPDRAAQHQPPPDRRDRPAPCGYRGGGRGWPCLPAPGGWPLRRDRQQPGHPWPLARQAPVTARALDPALNCQLRPTLAYSSRLERKRCTAPRPRTRPGIPGRARRPRCTGGSAPPSTPWSSTGYPAGGSARARPTSWCSMSQARTRTRITAGTPTQRRATLPRASPR